MRCLNIIFKRVVTPKKVVTELITEYNKMLNTKNACILSVDKDRVCVANTDQT